MSEVEAYLPSWNDPPAVALRAIQIEDDSLRDGLQGAFVERPSVAQKIELLRLSAAVGTHAAMLGFPAISADELATCRALVAAIVADRTPIVPRFLARATPADVEPIAALNDEFPVDVWADFFVCASPIRLRVERWELADVLARVAATARVLARRGTRFGVSLEDASRTPPAELRTLLRAALDGGAEVLTVCDTVGDATPAGARRLVEYVGETITQAGARAAIWWHGHNDRGLALANAIAAAEAGAHAISGAFLGLGERAGNTALEQVVMFLHQAGHPGFRVDRLAAYCARLAAYTGTRVPPNAPLVGDQAFATCTGTHAAAVLKARELGAGFEDYVFSAVPAGALGRAQEVLIGPVSGLANARYALACAGAEVSDDAARRLLAHAKAQNRWMTPEDVARFLVGNARVR